jgi:hypothetical protein
MRFREIKHIDEVMGLAGILYLALIFSLSFVLTQKLISNMRDSLKSSEYKKVPPPSFDIEGAEKALK